MDTESRYGLPIHYFLLVFYRNDMGFGIDVVVESVDEDAKDESVKRGVSCLLVMENKKESYEKKPSSICNHYSH